MWTKILRPSLEISTTMHRALLWKAATVFFAKDFHSARTSALSMAASNNATTTWSTSPGVDFIRHDSSSDGTLLLCHLKVPINSTQDEARSRLLTMNELPMAFAVLADIQLKGRGTQGRRWERGIDSITTADGNLYLTVCIPMASVPATITLLPLNIAVIVAQRLKKAVSVFGNKDPSVVKVKWPNDVLIVDRKVSGTLIENEIVQGQIWMLIGIGVNIQTTPSHIVGKRRPGSLQEHCTDQLPPDMAAILGTDIAHAIAKWSQTPKTAHNDEIILQHWRELADLGKPYELRGDVVDDDGYEGELVTVIDVANDGRLRVQGQDGRMRLLAADYLV